MPRGESCWLIKMADSEVDSKSARPFSVKLPQVTLGSRTIRYMTVSNDCRHFSVKDKLGSCVGLHLFMAADVLGGTSSLAKNNCRIHQRFGKEGLASKLFFSDCRLTGVSNSGSVWFYSIQGVFRAVFEYHSAEIQRDCLLKLRDLWLRSYTEESLPESMCLDLENSGTDVFTDMDLKHTIHAFQEELSSSFLLSDRDENHSLSSLAVNKCLHHIKDLHSKYPSETELSVVTQVLEFLKIELRHYHESPANCFPFELFNSYRSFLGDTSLHQELMNCDFNIPVRKHFALCAIAEWLGQEFHSLERSIAKRVETFKVEHINCIDNLPPAESIVSLLFPCAMKRLLIQWTGLNKLHSADCLNRDHNYSPPEKQQKIESEQTRNLFPLIQLILEFANNALVSGTAHVVFSRLRYAI